MRDDAVVGSITGLSVGCGALDLGLRPGPAPCQLRDLADVAWRLCLQLSTLERG